MDLAFYLRQFPVHRSRDSAARFAQRGRSEGVVQAALGAAAGNRRDRLRRNGA